MNNKNQKKIHVGFLLSYDYEKLKLSIPPVYNLSDKIFLAVDENLNTWSGNKFEIEGSFFKWLKETVGIWGDYYRKNGGITAERWLANNLPLIEQEAWETVYIPRFLF